MPVCLKTQVNLYQLSRFKVFLCLICYINSNIEKDSQITLQLDCEVTTVTDRLTSFITKHR